MYGHKIYRKQWLLLFLSTAENTTLIGISTCQEETLPRVQALGIQVVRGGELRDAHRLLPQRRGLKHHHGAGVGVDVLVIGRREHSHALVVVHCAPAFGTPLVRPQQPLQIVAVQEGFGDVLSEGVGATRTESRQARSGGRVCSKEII